MAAIPPRDAEHPFDSGTPPPGNGAWRCGVKPVGPFNDCSPLVGAGCACDTPFVYQHRDRLLLLVGNAQGWLLAELRFDRATCSYTELRRSEFVWPREALTALLSRIVTGTDRDAAVLSRVSEDFRAWASQQLAITHRPDGVRCPACPLGTN